RRALVAVPGAVVAAGAGHYPGRRLPVGTGADPVAHGVAGAAAAGRGDHAMAVSRTLPAPPQMAAGSLAGALLWLRLSGAAAGGADDAGRGGCAPGYRLGTHVS